MTYILIALATWRIASLLVNEDGPWNIFERLRRWAGIDDEEIPDRFLAGVLSCVWCSSLWIGAGWTLLFFFLPGVVEWLALPFALSAAAIGVEKFLKRG